MKDQELTLVGLRDDGTRLTLVSESGEEFTLPVDDKLRAAVRGDHARPGQLETKMESTLRPRDIQARIRAGESPESVADAAQTSLDKIMGYATPVLAERAHVAERAQRASVRRRAGEGSSRVLGETVAEHLRADNVDPGTVSWDAWRREDGRWTLVADLPAPAGGRRAEFVFDAPGRYVVAENDEAKVLVGEMAAATPPGTRSGSGRRLSAVGPADQELPLGEDAIGLVRGGDETTSGEPAAPAAQDEERTVDLTRTARTLRSPQPQPHGDPLVDELGGATGDADWIATQASDRPADTKPKQSDEAPAPAEDGEEDAEETDESSSSKKPTRKGRGRASVPSWDEIMFGGGRQD